MKQKLKVVLAITMLFTFMGVLSACDGKTPAVITPTPKTEAATPVVTDIPAATSTPAATDTPAPTDVPEPTKNPEPTAIPDEILDQFNSKDFFKDVEYCGDSLMNFYQWRGAQYTNSANFGNYNASSWLTLNSYAVRYAVKDEITAYDPKYKGEQVKLWDALPKTGKTRVFMFFGMNDIAATGIDKFIENYQALIKKIQQNGNFKFYILSITPIREDKQNPAKNFTNEYVDQANARLEQMCEENGYYYIDVATPLKNSDGHLNTTYSDGTNVHIIKEGYVFWDQVLIKFAKEQLYLESLNK